MNLDWDCRSFFVVEELDAELAFGTSAARPNAAVDRKNEGVISTTSNLERRRHQHFNRPRTIFRAAISKLAISIAPESPHCLAHRHEKAVVTSTCDHGYRHVEWNCCGNRMKLLSWRASTELP
jgi:hypothetical protein|eukprot:CAMPEP_0169242410 /NCGR_PEP_ID=MMETSP1016-20121227/32525_1 /TAXON_ID=342587 /ORGANISM="Karlodinium micrum, Strain CCMP2283" /LENGTH=122 /DNA_ID=CAMNT_0009322599 /DNA_START=473 /DNA_END=841 /DNA_ORIENTATION=+